MKKKGLVISLVVNAICLLAIPLSIVSFGFICPSQYDETYYGELPYMFNRLKNGKEGKIVIIGNSAVAFGVRSDIISEHLNKEVITFGLYGAIGTKAMMDLSKVGIKKNDIVILMPEITDQGLSLYFSSTDMWMAVDGHYDLLSYIGKDNKESMVGNYASFASKKASYLFEGHKPQVDGVYMQKSFNLDGQEVGYMTYDRAYNFMLNGYDSNAMITYDTNYLKDDFIEYVNDFNRYVHQKEASLYFGFVPSNSIAITSSADEIDTFYNELNSKISFPIIGNPHNYVFDYEWFYDNNTHLNSSGTYIYNRQIIEDLKILFEDDSPTDLVIPDKPVIPIPEYEEGDNSDLDCFNYEEDTDRYRIVSMTEKGLNKSSIIIPSVYQNKPIISFTDGVFKNNKNINEIVIPRNIRSLPNNGFFGCTNLTKIVLQHTNPNTINVGMALLDGADSCSVYVKTDCYDNFVNHYNWGYYHNRLKKY